MAFEPPCAFHLGLGRARLRRRERRDGEAVETFVRCEDADRFLEEIRLDDAELAERVRVEPVEFDA
jgi:hypothetical protein